MNIFIYSFYHLCYKTIIPVFKYYDYPQRTDFPALRIFKTKSIVIIFKEKSQNIWGNDRRVGIDAQTSKVIASKCDSSHKHCKDPWVHSKSCNLTVPG